MWLWVNFSICCVWGAVYVIIVIFRWRYETWHDTRPHAIIAILLIPTPSEDISAIGVWLRVVIVAAMLYRSTRTKMLSHAEYTFGGAP